MANGATALDREMKSISVALLGKIIGIVFILISVVYGLVLSRQSGVDERQTDDIIALNANVQELNKTMIDVRLFMATIDGKLGNIEKSLK